MNMFDTKNYAEINLSALIRNFKLLRRHVQYENPKARPICVVKADAYGHGMADCVNALLSAGADFFAVSDIAEALEIRRLTKSASILILGYTRPANAYFLYTNNIIQTVHSKNYADYLNTAMETDKASGLVPADAKLSVHIKLDSGMNRLGFALNDRDFHRSIAEIARLPRLQSLQLDGIFTHLACADEPDSPMTELQANRFFEARRALEAKGLVLPAHAANSAAAIRFGSMQGDFVRLGIALYGLPPSDEVLLEGLCPVMSLYSRISEIHLLRKGETVSYGAHFCAENDMRIATVAIGYADGLLRSCGQGGTLLVNGKPAPIVGRICMDQCMIALQDIEAYEGDTVTVYDPEGCNIRALARAAGTIPYELLCLTGLRVHRRYTREMPKI